jgi:acetyltransferase-like isoleucine patch superfamily enzyme
MFNYIKLLLIMFSGKSVVAKASFLFNLKVTGCKNGNAIEGKAKIDRAARIRFKGKGNKIVFGKCVTLRDVRVNFSGDNSIFYIDDDCILNGRFVLKSNCSIDIGKGTKFNSRESKIHCGEPNGHVKIGAGCLLADVKMRTSDQHSIIDMESGLRTNPPKNIFIGDEVWIAEDVYVYKGAIIGAGSIVGARSTVTGMLPPNSICLGTPAKAVKSGVTWQDEPLAALVKADP